MFLHIQPSDSLAIYDQVVRQVKFAVASGAIRPGEFVLSVRELARDLAINPNTVARAYRQLQDEGILETVRGTGLAIAKRAAALSQAAVGVSRSPNSRGIARSSPEPTRRRRTPRTRRKRTRRHPAVTTGEGNRKSCSCRPEQASAVPASGHHRTNYDLPERRYACSGLRN